MLQKIAETLFSLLFNPTVQFEMYNSAFILIDAQVDEIDGNSCDS